MKVIAYMKVGKTQGKKGYMVHASATSNTAPFVKKGYNKTDEVLPTVYFALELNLDDAMFKNAETVVAAINVGMKQMKVTGEITVPDGIKVIQKTHA